MDDNASVSADIGLLNTTAAATLQQKTGYLEASNATIPTNLESLETALLVMEVIIYIAAFIILWLLLCTIVYGTKTGRWWKKPGSSSLGNGKIFVACVLAITTTIPKLVVVILLYRSLKDPDDGISCENILLASPFMYLMSCYGVYLFLWILQRQIFCHPSVKRRVNKHVDLVSKYFVILLTVGFGVFGAIFWVFGKNAYSLKTCMVQDSDLERKLVLPITVGIGVIQVALVALSLYPAFRARFTAAHSGDSPEHQRVSVSEDGKTSRENESSFKRFFINISYSLTISPVHAHVRRSVFSAIGILLSDVIASLVNIVIPKSAPVQIQWFSYDINLVIDVFCMLLTFSYGPKILSLFCPTTFVKTKRIRIKKTTLKENAA